MFAACFAVSTEHTGAARGALIPAGEVAMVVGPCARLRFAVRATSSGVEVQI